MEGLLCVRFIDFSERTLATLCVQFSSLVIILFISWINSWKNLNLDDLLEDRQGHSREIFNL